MYRRYVSPTPYFFPATSMKRLVGAAAGFLSALGLRTSLLDFF